MQRTMKKIFENRKVVLLTKHKKEEAIKSALEKETGCELIVESRFDTDKLGTFSREIKRPKSQLDTARMKIRKGLKLTKTDIGIASEGSLARILICLFHGMLRLYCYTTKKKIWKFTAYTKGQILISVI